MPERPLTPPQRLHAVIQHHARTGGEFTYGDIRRLLVRAGVTVVEAQHQRRAATPPAVRFRVATKCARCGRKIMAAHAVGGALYGEKCAAMQRRNIEDAR